MPKITKSANKKLTKYGNKYPKFQAFIKLKLCDVSEGGSGKKAHLFSHKALIVNKFFITSPYGHFRLICVSNSIVDIALVDIYDKSSKSDLTQNELKELKNQISDSNFWLNLEDL